MLVLLMVTALAILLAWFAQHGRLSRESETELRSSLRNVDVLCFENLLRTENDVFLREALSTRNYRMAKRAKTRAIQQYLRWIASDCSIFQVLVSRDEPLHPERMHSLVARASRLRATSLVLWLALWVQWMFPGFSLLPGSVLERYQWFVLNSRAYLASHVPLSLKI